MLKNMYFRGDKWEITKIIIAILCVILIIDQVSSGIRMINSNNNLPNPVSSEGFDYLTAGTEIRGELNHIEGTLYGDAESEQGTIQYYIMVTEAKKILLFRTNSGSTTDKELQSLIKKNIQTVGFRGYVREITDADKTALNLELITSNFLRSHGIKGGTQNAMLGVLVDITDPDDKIPEKYIVLTFVLAGILVLLIPLLLRKTVKNAYISLAIHSGKINDKRLLEKKDYIFDDGGIYNTEKEQNDSFYVNTEHNLRNEGAADECNEELMTHMVSQEDLFYEGGLNDEGNFYVDSTKKNQTPYCENPDEDNYLKKY